MNNIKIIIFSIIIAIVLVGGFFMFSKNIPKGNSNTFVNSGDNNVNNVSVVDGKQIVEIKAKGGYFPRRSVAKAGVPSILRFNTNGTFDCSSFVRIPSMNINKNLIRTGSTDIDIGVQPAGVFNGSCGMGMYPFEIDFQN